MILRRRASPYRHRAIEAEISYVAGATVAFNARRKKWAVIRGGRIIAEADSKQEAELIADPECLWAALSDATKKRRADIAKYIAEHPAPPLATPRLSDKGT